MKSTLLALALSPAAFATQSVTPDDLVWIEKEIEPNIGLKWNGGLSAVPALQHVFTWFGGINFVTVYDETWSYDGEQWVQQVVPGPIARCHQYQSEFRDGMLMFGGEADVLATDRQNDTWFWDGSAWMELSPAQRPSRRCCGKMVYDTARQVVVLHGGVDQDLLWLSDTWEFDGNDWTQVSAVGPPPRSNAGMSYDASRNVIVLYGGLAPDFSLYGDTWEWDGNAWTQVANDGPSPRWAPAMTYHGELDVTLLYGGEGDNFDIRDDTWTWDGSDWIELAVTGPEPRVEASFAFDDSSGVAILASGFTLDDPANLDHTWELDCVSPAEDLGFEKVSGNGFYPQFRVCGAIEAGSSAELRVRKAPASTVGLLMISDQAAPTRRLGGTIVPASPRFLGPYATDASGALTVQLSGGIGGPAGEVYAQWVFVDPDASFGYGITNALRIAVAP